MRLSIPCAIALSIAARGVAGLDDDSGGAERRVAYERHALTQAGDADKGAALFRDARRTRCLACHVVKSEGTAIGPELTSVGGKLDRPHLVESLLDPSRQIGAGYFPAAIVTKRGDALTGIVKAESATDVTLFDIEAKKHVVAKSDIASRAESRTSLMPEGLADALSIDEFTDLIAYLETLQPGGKPKFGSDVVGPITLPDGFEVRTIATGLSGGTALEIAPDGRIFICEQPGAVRIVEDGKLLETPFVELPVHATGERGVIGVTVDPDFPRTPHVFVCWIAGDPYTHHRVTRFVADGNVARPGSALTLIEGDDQETMGGSFKAGHQGGALHFGLDGKLYISVGEQTAMQPAQDLGTFLGKILRIEPDGSIPADNPFVDRTAGKYRAIWAYGFRNPYTFAVHPKTGLMLANDVGGMHEEINVVRRGDNHGWPTADHGPGDPREYARPIHWYPQACIAGGDFCLEDSPWPAEHRGRYFFADFNHGWIHTIDPAGGGAASVFGERLRRPIDMRFAAGGSLYVLLRNAWLIDDQFQGETSSLVRIDHDGGDRAPATP